MSAATIAALDAALARGTLDDWLEQLPGASLRGRLRQAIEIDRRLWSEHPASLGSCLLVRTFGVAGLDELQGAWVRELDERGSPWVRPLRGLPVAEGLLAELHAGGGLDLRGLLRPSFESDDVLILVAYRLHPSVQAPEERRRDRLRWAWLRGEARLEPDPRTGEAERRELYPRIEHDGWGPAFLVRVPGGERIALPCPEESSADGHVSADGSRLFVYGSLDEYAGGFAWMLDPTTLAVKRRLSTRRPVSKLHECERDDLLLAACYGDELVVWEGDRSRTLRVRAREACLSPSGRYLATVGEGLRVWSLAELEGRPPKPGFPTCFDPSGERLLSGTRLYDGRGGAWLAEVEPELGEYLMGGPAWPWFHFGTRYLICLHSAMHAYDARSGEPLAVAEPLRFPHWYSVAYDRAGERLAVLSKHGSGSELYELPSGRKLGELKLLGSTVALSADASLVAARDGLVVEVRTSLGRPWRRFVHPRGEPPDPVYFRDDSLRFSADGRHIASFVKGDGWRVWAVEGDGQEHFTTREAIEEVAGFAPPRPRDWSIEEGSSTLFVHRSTGTRIALPAAGPWVTNPAAPEIVASDALHVELRG